MRLSSIGTSIFLHHIPLHWYLANSLFTERSIILWLSRPQEQQSHIIKMEGRPIQIQFETTPQAHVENDHLSQAIF